MQNLFKRSIVYLMLALVGGCADLSSRPDSTATTDSNNCVGTVMAPPAGLKEIKDSPLLQSAEGQPGKGGLCIGKVFVAEKQITVYRVWDGSKSYTALGRWWALSYPVGTRDSYRKANDICPEWSALDRVSVCTLKVGTKIAIGPGQSAQCNEGLYPPMPENQVYIPNDTASNQVFVENCTDSAWPKPVQ